MLLYVRPTSIVWGTGANSTEPFRKMKTLGAGHHSEQAKYHSVRGPLTRSLIASAGGHCPEVYGDPALLVPYLFDKTREDIPKTHKIGVIIRCNDWAWKDAVPGDNVKLIDLKTTDVEKTLIDILSCEKIVSSALHGLIISDAFNIPNAWLWTPKVTGASCSASGRFKYLDYFMSVDKIRDRHMYKIKNVPGALDASNLEKHFNFDDRPINFILFDVLVI